MATITLRYNPRNSVAKSIIEMIKNVGVFTIETPKKLSGIEQSLLDIKEGRVFKADSAEDLIQKCLQ